jgi:hypothetical protein
VRFSSWPYTPLRITSASQQSSVLLGSDRLHRSRFIEAIKKRSACAGTWSRMEASEHLRLDETPAKRSSYADVGGVGRRSGFSEGQSARQLNSTGISASPFLVPYIAMLGEVSPRRGPRKKSDKRIRTSSPEKTASAPYSLPDWLLPRSQTHRATRPRKGKLLCGEFPRCIVLAAGGDASLRPKNQH